MDLLKGFDSIPHDLFIVKMQKYGFSIDSLTFFYSYLKRRTQNVRIKNNAHNVFQILLSGLTQRSVLEPILFNIFVNCLFLYLS